MTLEEFATQCGVRLIGCERDAWGGSIAYTSKDSPSAVCGFRTPSSAYKHWLADTFGEQTSKTIQKILKGSKS